MFSKEKMFIIADNIDDSIKMQIASYDVSIFKSIMEFERIINSMPVVVNTVIVTTSSLPFTGTNVQRLMRALSSPFFTLSGNLIYLADAGYDAERIREFVERKKLNWAFYFNEITPEYIVSIANGEGRHSDEIQSEVVTYRIRAEEYVRQQSIQRMQDGLDTHYVVDDELFSGVPSEEEPEDINPTVERITELRYVVGQDCISRTLLSFLVAQYLSLNDKTLILEKDTEYHKLTELVTKSGIKCCYIDVTELLENFQKALSKMQSSIENLVVIGSKRRVSYSYEFLFDILYSNLKGNFTYMVRECDFNETVYGRDYILVMDNNIPDALKTCTSLRNDIDEDHVSIIGLQLGTLGAINLTSSELREVLSVVLGKNHLRVQVMKVAGINLRGDEQIYDLFSFLTSNSH